MLLPVADPIEWSPENVRSWVAYTCQQFCLPLSQMDWLQLDGRALCSLDEQQFVMCAPQVSSSYRDYPHGRSVSLRYLIRRRFG